MVYGAGKNLFTNPIISFFMHNLGAYRVDRRIRAQLYKEALKAYSCVVIERGYHSLFFPGGTRSRSGAIERRLKLGLAGTGVEAFSRNQVRGIDRPVYFVPATINYGLVLEAETLIDDHLKEEGRARYIIEDDEFSRVERWVAFFNKFFGLESACVVRLGEPVDPFGNPVDDQGRSIAPDGRPIDAADYVKRRGTAVIDHARDAAYTRELGRMIARVYESDTVVMPTQLVAHVIFRRLVRATPNLDLFSRLRHRGDVAIPCDELATEIGEARDGLLSLEREGRVHASSVLRRESPDRLPRPLARGLGRLPLSVGRPHRQRLGHRRRTPIFCCSTKTACATSPSTSSAVGRPIAWRPRKSPRWRSCRHEHAGRRRRRRKLRPWACPGRGARRSSRDPVEPQPTGSRPRADPLHHRGGPRFGRRSYCWLLPRRPTSKRLRMRCAPTSAAPT